MYESFEFLYNCLLECFQLFDNNGQLKDAQKSKGDFEVALELIQSLKHQEINQQIKSIEACKQDLFHFTCIAKEVVTELSENIDKDVLPLICLAYQVQKNAIKLKNQPQRKAALKRKEAYILAFVEEFLGDKYQAMKDEVYTKLEQIVQSSAAVECINSVLRPYLNTSKNQVSQEFLNLFMFYHNHRRFNAGKRKGKTPAELFTGQPQKEDWLDLMLKMVA